MLKDADLLIEFWDEAGEYDAILCNITDTGPVIDGKTVSPYEAYTGKIPDVKPIRVWGSKCYQFIHRKTIAKGQRHDKLVDTGRIGVFIGFSQTTNKHFKVYAPELGYTTRSSHLRVDENIKGGTVDLKFRKGNSQGTRNWFDDRKPVGRLRRIPSRSPYFLCPV